MKRPYQGSLSITVFVLCCLVWQISGLARVDNRRPNATHNQWHHQATTRSPIRGSWNAPVPANQFGRNNQTMGHSNWQRHNQTNQFPAVQSPWMRNNQTYQAATTVTPNRGWNTPTTNQWNQRNNNNNWSSHNGTQQVPRFQPALPPQQNNPWVRNNQTQPSYQPQNPQQSMGWAVRPNATATTRMPANTNGWGSSGFGQPNWHNSQQYPGAPGGVPAQNNFNNGPIPGFSGQSYNRTNGSSGWSAPAQLQPIQANSGAVPLAPIGGINQWNGGGNVPPQGGAVPLAPLSGGSGATTWNAGGQAGLSYANGQTLPAASGQQKPGDSSNPYAHLFN